MQSYSYKTAGRGYQPRFNSSGTSCELRALWVGPPDAPLTYPTIQAALDASQDSDVVLLGQGVYTGPGNVELTPRGKAITLRGPQSKHHPWQVAGNAPAAAVVDCGGAAQRGIWMRDGEGRGASMPPSPL